MIFGIFVRFLLKTVVDKVSLVRLFAGLGLGASSLYGDGGGLSGALGAHITPHQTHNQHYPSSASPDGAGGYSGYNGYNGYSGYRDSILSLEDTLVPADATDARRSSRTLTLLPSSIASSLGRPLHRLKRRGSSSGGNSGSSNVYPSTDEAQVPPLQVQVAPLPPLPPLAPVVLPGGDHIDHAGHTTNDQQGLVTERFRRGGDHHVEDQDGALADALELAMPYRGFEAYAGALITDIDLLYNPAVPGKVELTEEILYAGGEGGLLKEFREVITRREEAYERGFLTRGYTSARMAEKLRRSELYGDADKTNLGTWDGRRGRGSSSKYRAANPRVPSKIPQSPHLKSSLEGSKVFFET